MISSENHFLFVCLYNPIYFWILKRKLYGPQRLNRDRVNRCFILRILSALFIYSRFNLTLRKSFVMIDERIDKVSNNSFKDTQAERLFEFIFS